MTVYFHTLLKGFLVNPVPPAEPAAASPWTKRQIITLVVVGVWVLGMVGALIWVYWPSSKAPSAAPAASEYTRPVQPNWSDPVAFAGSKPFSALKIGEIGYTLSATPEPQSDRDAYVLKTPGGQLCLSPYTRVWPSPVSPVGPIFTIDTAVKRIDVDSFQLIGPNVKDFPWTFPADSCTNQLTVTTAPSDRSVLGWLPDLREGQTAYVPAHSVWAADAHAAYGVYMGTTSSDRRFPGSLGVVRRGRLIQLASRPTGVDLVGKPQMDDLHDPDLVVINF